MGALGTTGQLGEVPAHRRETRPLTTMPLFLRCRTQGPSCSIVENGSSEQGWGGFNTRVFHSGWRQRARPSTVSIQVAVGSPGTTCTHVPVHAVPSTSIVGSTGRSITQGWVPGASTMAPGKPTQLWGSGGAGAVLPPCGSCTPPWPMNTPVGCQQSWLLAAASLPGAPPDWHRQHRGLAEGYYGRCPNLMCQQ